MKSFGVTGGIGAGKSAVCSMLADLGAEIFDADREARDLMETDTSLVQGIRELFGSEAYRPDGSLDRAFVSSRVFGDTPQAAKCRRALEEIVHPAVAQRFREVGRQAERRGVSALVREQALLPAPGSDASRLPWVVVEAPAGARLERTLARGGLTREEARARMDAQPPDASYRAVADYIIVNDGDLDALRKKVHDLWILILSENGRFQG